MCVCLFVVCVDARVCVCVLFTCTATHSLYITQVSVYPEATKTDEGYLDTNQCDISVVASLGQLRLVILYLFISKMSNFLKQLQLSQNAIEQAKKSAQQSASAAVTAVSLIGSLFVCGMSYNVPDK